MRESMLPASLLRKWFNSFTKLNSPTSKLLFHSPNCLVPSSFSRRWFVWNHPFEKYANVKLEHFPKFRGENKNIFETTTYPPVNKHSNGKSPSWIGNTSWNGGFYIAMLDYRSVVLVVHLGWGEIFCMIHSSTPVKWPWATRAPRAVAVPMLPQVARPVWIDWIG